MSKLCVNDVCKRGEWIVWIVSMVPGGKGTNNMSLSENGGCPQMVIEKMTISRWIWSIPWYSIFSDKATLHRDSLHTDALKMAGIENFYPLVMSK